MAVSKDMKIIDILKLDRETANIFLRHGLHCLGCPSANGESLQDACMAHNIDADELIGELNTHLAKL